MGTTIGVFEWSILEGITTELGPALVGSVARVTLVLVGAGVIALFMRRGSASTRHMIWGLSLAISLALPLASLVLPKVALEVPGWGEGVVPLSSPRVEAVASPDPRVGESILPDIVENPTPAVSRAGEASFAATRVAGAVASPERRVTAPTAARTIDLAGLTMANWPSILMGVWIAGVAVLLAGVALGLWRVRRMSVRARPVTHGGWLQAARRAAESLGLRRDVRLVESERLMTPMTWGVARPTILIPSVARSWTPDRRRTVLLHELAHAKRLDYATQLLARVTCAVFWFHPLVWMAAHRLRAERERACDDAVLAVGTKPSDYAGHLVDIARSLRAGSMIAYATVPMARRSQLGSRVRAVLDVGCRREPLGGRAVSASWMAAALVTISLATVAPVSSSELLMEETPGVSPVAVSRAVRGALRPAPTVSPIVSAERVAAPGWASPTNVTRPSFLAGGAPQSQAGTWASAPRCRHDVRGRSNFTSSDDDHRESGWRDGDCEGHVRIDGRIDFSDDFTDVVRVPDDGRFSIEIDDGRIATRLEIRNRGRGMQLRWWIDGDQQDDEAGARAWLALALTDFFRHTGYLGEERAAMILEARGVDGLLQEAEQSHSGWVSALFYQAAFDTGRLSPAEVNEILLRARDTIDSDFALGRLLAAIPTSALEDPTVRQTYVRTSGAIDSDFEKARALLALLGRDDLSDETVLMLLGEAQTIDSDFELARVLTNTAGRYLTTPALRRGFMDAARNIESDFELGRVLGALLEEPNLDDAIVLDLVSVSRDIESDFELARLLRATTSRYAVNEQIRPVLFQSIGSIDSDFERARVLRELLDAGPAPAMTGDILRAAATIDSDHELARLLVSIDGAVLRDAALRAVYLRAVASIESDYEAQRAIGTLIESGNLPDDVVLDILDVATRIDSDHSLSTVLIAVAQRYPQRPVVIERVRTIAEDLDSDTSYRRVMRAIR